MMNWLRNFGIFVCIACAQSLTAANPDDVDFRLRLTKDAPVYHMGEPVEFEISYSTQSEKKYQASWTNPMPGFSVVMLHLTPAEGIVDLQELRRGYATGGSILSSGPGYLGSQPVVKHADMSGWYRFQAPGHYSLVITSNEVWRQKGAEQGGGQERLNLESNPAEFDILPADPSWEAQELSSIMRTLGAAMDSSERLRALYRLA